MSIVVPDDGSIDEVTLVFREQEDGRKVSRLPSGKVVLVDLQARDVVADGERWLVRLEHRDSFAIAYPVDRIPPALDDGEAPSLEHLAIEDGQTEDVPPPEPRASWAPRPTSFTLRPDDVVSKDDRVALFVDGANMDGACRSAGFFADYRRARDYFVGPGRFSAAHYYAPDHTPADPVQVRFFDFLSHQGYVVHRKPIKTIRDEATGDIRTKCDLDTDIVIDMISTADNYDVAFLFSGDSDFERAAHVLRGRGKRVHVVAARASLSKELAYAADKPIFWLEDHRTDLERLDRHPGEPARTAAEA